MEPVPFDMGSKHYELVLPWTVIREFERKVGKGYAQVDLGVNVDDTLTLLYYAAKTNSKNTNLQLEKFISNVSDAAARGEVRMADITTVLLETLKRSFAWKEDDSEESGEGERPLGSSNSSAA